ncbi:MAG: helix-turn-helix transcriptional regulator [Gemmatimonadota bacterium]
MALPLMDTPAVPSGLAAVYKGPRAQILMELKRAQPRTAKELAGLLGLSLNAVRHHLKELEAEGLVGYAREHRGVGAPVYAYRLSEAGDALFPRRYEETLTHVLDHVVEHHGREAAVAMLEAHVRAIADRLKAETDGRPPEERVDLVARMRARQGYMAEWRPAEGGALLKEHNCAIQAVAERFPEVCAAERQLLEDVLGTKVERISHILSGCSACEYRVTFAGDEPVQIRSGSR